MLIYDCLYMLPNNIVMTCTFGVRMLQLLVEMLFPLVLELDLLIYAEFDDVGCSCFYPVVYDR